MDRLAYEPDRLNEFVGSRHSGIGGASASAALILSIAIGVVFFSFSRRLEAMPTVENLRVLTQY